MRCATLAHSCLTRCPAEQHIPAPTDILSFGLFDDEPKLGTTDSNLESLAVDHALSDHDLGDLVLGVEYVQRWTASSSAAVPLTVRVPGEEPEVAWQQRVPVILAHGLAHLLGHTHEEDTDHQQMQATLSLSLLSLSLSLSVCVCVCVCVCV